MANFYSSVLKFGLLSLGLILCQARQGFAQQGATRAAAPENPALSSRIDPKAQALLDKVTRALGGEAFQQVKTKSSRGRVFSISEGAASGYAPFESDTEYPDKRRFSYGKDQPVILINNGDRGWEHDRYGLIRQKPEQIRTWQIAMRYGSESLLRNVIREPGVLILDAGVDFVDLLPVRILEI